MRVLDVRWARLAVAAGAIAGSALVSSVAVAADESPPTEPPVTTAPDLVSIEVGQSSADVIVVDPPPGMPFEETVVIEIVVPDPEGIVPGTVDPTTVEPIAVIDGEESADESIAMTVSDPVAVTSLDTEMVEVGSHLEEEAEGGEGEHGSGHEGGSGGQGNPYRMTFTVVWEDAGGTQITTFDAILTPEVLAQFELSAASQTGKGEATSATCTYPDDDMVLHCEFDNPGHGSGSDGLVVPARPTATYTVTVAPIQGWTISGANDDAYSVRDLGGEGCHEGGGVPCVHTVVMRQVKPATPPPPTQPPAPPAQDSAVVPPVTTPAATTTTAPTEPEPAAQSFATAPSSLPTTGGSISMIVVAAGVLVAMGSALAGLTRRTS